MNVYIRICEVWMWVKTRVKGRSSNPGIEMPG